MRIFRMVMIVILAMAGGCISDPAEPEWSLQPGDPLPQFEVVTLDGKKVGADDSFDSPLVIVFFNTSCADCRRELPEIQKLYEENMLLPDSERALYICIAREEEADDIEKYWTECGLTLPVAPQPDRRIYSLFASSGIPRIYVARNGIIISAK